MVSIVVVLIVHGCTYMLGSVLIVHRCTYMVGRLGTVDGGRDGGVAIGSTMVDLSIGLGLCFCADGGGNKGQSLRMNTL